MKRLLTALTLSATLCMSREGLAEERARPPSKGTGFLVTGVVLTAVGVVTVIGTPSICKNGSGTATTGKSTEGCERFGYILGATFGAVGIPLMIVGIVKRSSYNAWLAEHPVASGLSMTGHSGGGMLGWSTTF